MRINKGRYPEIDLQLGHKRKLYNSEIYRGFIFITGAKQRSEFIDDDNLTVLFHNKVIKNKAIDKAGRIHFGTSLFENIEYNSAVTIKIIDRKTIKITFDQAM